MKIYMNFLLKNKKIKSRIKKQKIKIKKKDVFLPLGACWINFKTFICISYVQIIKVLTKMID